MRTFVIRSAALLGFTLTLAVGPGGAALAGDDLVPPETTITSGPTGTINYHSATFTFVSSEAGSSFECKVDTGAFAGCATPFTTSSLANGSHSFAVRAIDPAGDIDPTPATSAYTIDTVEPQTKITGGPTGTTSDSTPTFTFASSGAAAFQCRLDAVAFVACPTPFTTAPLADGVHRFEVRAFDEAGNIDATPAGRSFTVSTLGPPPPVPTCQGKRATIVGTADDDRIRGTGGRDVIVGLGGDDVIDAGAGHDLVCAGAGDDRAAGGSGEDVIVGEAGRDRAVGGGGDDRLLGTGGHDRLAGNGGDDRLAGGGGDDRLLGKGGDDHLDGGPGRDEGRGGPGRDVVVRCES